MTSPAPQSATALSETRMLAATRTEAVPLKFSRVLAVEYRKLVSTRANRALLGLILGGGVAIGVICAVFHSQLDELTSAWMLRTTLIQLPAQFLVPVLLILLVTSEWSTRSAMTTFTLVPHRGLVVAAKTVAALSIAVATWLITAGLGALSTATGAAIAGSSAVWDIPLGAVLGDLAAFVILMISAYALALLIQNGPAAIVTYFAAPVALVTVAMSVRQLQEPISWIDLQSALDNTLMVGGEVTGAGWARLATSAVIWILVPMVVGTIRTLRREAV